MAQILDYSAGYPGGTAIRTAGYEGVIRYLRKEGDSRVRPITASELADMRAHGRTVALVCQHLTKSRPTQGRAAGRHDAEWALARAREIGTADPFIYMAVDFDADPASVREYFIGAGEVISVDRLGGYGGFRVIAFLFDQGLISKGWQTAAWSGGRREGRAHLFQRIGQVTVGGISCDVNDVLKADYGQIPSPQEDDMANWTPENVDEVLYKIHQLWDALGQTWVQNDAQWIGDMVATLGRYLPDKQDSVTTAGGLAKRLDVIQAALVALAARPIADVDEAALAAELEQRGIGGATAEQVKEAVRAAFARAGQETP